MTALSEGITAEAVATARRWLEGGGDLSRGFVLALLDERRNLRSLVARLDRCRIADHGEDIVLMDGPLSPPEVALLDSIREEQADG